MACHVTPHRAVRKNAPASCWQPGRTRKCPARSELSVEERFQVLDQKRMNKKASKPINTANRNNGHGFETGARRRKRQGWRVRTHEKLWNYFKYFWTLAWFWSQSRGQMRITADLLLRRFAISCRTPNIHDPPHVLHVGKRIRAEGPSVWG